MTPVIKLLALTAGLSVAAWYGTIALCEWAKYQERERAFKKSIDQIYKDVGAS